MPDLSSAASSIPRHRTAMVRHDLSQPMALLMRHGLIKLGKGIFDYGCGQGDDLRILCASGFDAAGWDPHFKPDSPLLAAPVVNLGFVLNVIEDPAERRDALVKAWALSEQVLAVATMIAGQVPTGGLQPHGDGYLTSRGTFQKYFQHAELRTFISQSIAASVVAVAPGIFFAFRRPEDEQDFLLNRRAHRRSLAGYRIPREMRAVRAARPAFPERIPTAIADIATFVRDRGRIPAADELSQASVAELADQKVSLSRAVEACLQTAITQDELASAGALRREDLLVHYALGLLNRSTSTSRPSAAIVRDVRTHFGSQKELMAQASGYLHALADETHVRKSLAEAAGSGLGVPDHRGRLAVDSNRADDLPGVLRCYLGCATFLSGEPEGRFLIRIDAERRRVAMWPIINVKDPFPASEISIRVDLRRQDVSIRQDARRLVRKSEIFGLSARSKQRNLEALYRQERSLHPDALFERI